MSKNEKRSPKRDWFNPRGPSWATEERGGCKEAWSEEDKAINAGLILKTKRVDRKSEGQGES